MERVKVSLHNHIINPRGFGSEELQKLELRLAIRSAFKEGIDVLAITEMNSEPDYNAPFNYIREGRMDGYSVRPYSGFCVIERNNQRLYFCSGVEVDVMLPSQFTQDKERSGHIVLIGYEPEELRFRLGERIGRYTDDERRRNWTIFENYVKSGQRQDLLSFASHPGDSENGFGDGTIKLVENGYIDTYEAYNAAFGRCNPEVNLFANSLEKMLGKKGI
ncbi:MAG: hypothetical protein ACW98D_19020, partial [Promethearchaeota archaeon]